MKKQFFAKGKRSIVYLIDNKYILKEHKNRFRAKNEAKFLKILNKKGIGPKLISIKNKEITMECIKGERIIPCLENKKKTKRIIKNILNQCRTLDKLRINKYELKNPYKHILINKKPVQIDFERCKTTKNPKNTTQFCQFLTSKRIKQITKINKKHLIKLLKEYKKSQTDKNFKEIENYITKNLS